MITKIIIVIESHYSAYPLAPKFKHQKLLPMCPLEV